MQSAGLKKKKMPKPSSVCLNYPTLYTYLKLIVAHAKKQPILLKHWISADSQLDLRFETFSSDLGHLFLPCFIKVQSLDLYLVFTVILNDIHWNWNDSILGSIYGRTHTYQKRKDLFLKIGYFHIYAHVNHRPYTVRKLSSVEMWQPRNYTLNFYLDSKLLFLFHWYSKGASIIFFC